MRLRRYEDISRAHNLLYLHGSDACGPTFLRPSTVYAKDVSSLLSSISSAGDSFAQHAPGAREQLLSLTYKLAAALETPSEVIQRIGWAEPARGAAMQVAVDLQIFDKLAGNDGAAVSSAELAKQTGAEDALITRTMKHLAAMNVVAESSADSYTATPLSKALTESRFRDGITYTYYVAGPSFQGIPAYLKKTNYRNPRDIADGPFQFGHKTNVPFWVYLGEHPELLQCFNNYMAGYRQGKSSWLEPDFYPVTDRLGEDIKGDEDAVLLVDVGGGMGHDLEEIKAMHPHLSGRLVLQERAEVVSQITNLSPGIEATVHDFFTPQPIKGAKAYYLHSVLHDWDDDTCGKILTPLVSALEKGYSKVLINELVVPDVGASWSITSMDWLMLALGAVRERTEKEWHKLLESVGLKIIKIWTYEQGTESLIEAELC